MTDVTARVSLIEQALARLTTIQEEQTKQTEKIIASVDNFTKISVTVEQNAKDIDYIHEAITKLGDKIANTKDHTSEVKDYCTALSFSRLRIAISASIAVTTAVFGYLYSDIYEINKKCYKFEEDVIRIDVTQRQLREKLYTQPIGVLNGKVKR